MIASPATGVSTTLLASVRRIVRLRADFDISGVRDEQLTRRIQGFLHRMCVEPDHLIGRLELDQQLFSSFVDSLTVNVTSVFRNRQHWETLATLLAPLPREPRVWSAGCSTGAEPITLAALCHLAGKRARVLATDIDRTSLALAAEPRFEARDLSEVPPTLRDRLFQSSGGDEWTPRSWLIERIETRVHDVTARPPRTGFDLIACRNVVIYFNATTSATVHRHLASALRPGGLLFIGNAERVLHPEELGLDLVAPFIYRADPDQPGQT